MDTTEKNADELHPQLVYDLMREVFRLEELMKQANHLQTDDEVKRMLVAMREFNNNVEAITNGPAH